MAKITLGPNIFIYPMPVTLVGANVAGKANFLAVGWVTRANLNPPLLLVALNKAHYTPLGIRENQNFSVNFPGADLMAETDYCGLVSGRKTDKSGIFTVFYGELKTAPMIQECPLCLECRLYEIVSLPSNDLFIGEIVAGYSEARYLTDGKPDLKKMNPLVLSMPDNNYWTVGPAVGKAWSAGQKKLKKTEG
jgi:flavin reductase (DIM6/NTAB) family NADH-FMN oxidoreductase RutF